MTTKRRILISGVAALALAAPVAATAAGSAQTIDLYAVKVSQVLQNAHGKTLPHGTNLAVGEVVVGTKKVYEGTQAHHSTATDGTITTRCRLTKVVSQDNGTASCTGTWSVHGSTLTAGPITASVQGPPEHFTIKIIRATGSFAGDHGTWTNTRLANKDNEIVLRLSA
jgi:hypothetical protein